MPVGSKLHACVAAGWKHCWREGLLALSHEQLARFQPPLGPVQRSMATDIAKAMRVRKVITCQINQVQLRGQRGDDACLINRLALNDAGEDGVRPGGLAIHPGLPCVPMTS